MVYLELETSSGKALIEEYESLRLPETNIFK